MRRKRGRRIRYCLLSAGILFLFFSAGSPQAADKVQFGLNWIPYGQFLGFFGALGEGFYKAEGIEVEWHRGYGMADAAKKVASGSLEFVLSDISNAALGRARGLQIKSVALHFGKAPMVVVSFKEAGIRNPKDLEGRSIITAPKDIQDQTFPFFARIHGVKNWKIVHVDPGAKNPSLLTGKGDALLTFVILEPILKRMAAKMGREVVVMKWSDFGFEALSEALLVRDDTIRAKPDLVRRFVRGTLLGYAWSLENPGKAADHFMRFVPTATRDIELEQWLIAGSLIMTPYARAQGIGRHDPALVAKTRDLMFEIYDIKETVPPGDIYTEEFLPKEKIIPKFGS